MLLEGFQTASKDGTVYNRFWCTIGGGIEKDESIQQAALREIYEETGIIGEHIEFGPIVWHQKIEVVLKGTPTILSEDFIVAKTNISEVHLKNVTIDERAVVRDLVWFSHKDINDSKDVIFPQSLADYLPDILANKYPRTPLRIDGSVFKDQGPLGSS